MLRIALLPWDEARVHAAPIRFEVFVEEQGVPRDLELDRHDALSLHVLAFEQEKAVATARLLPDGHIGRMAVLRPWRGQGIGGAMLQRLMAAARARGDREVVLAAQVQAVPFYRAHGFVATGTAYLEAGILHQDMRRAP